MFSRSVVLLCILLVCAVAAKRVYPQKCYLPMGNMNEDGLSCRAIIPRYYFNIKTEKCERFIYGGCYGNENRFETEELCNEECTNKAEMRRA